MAQNFPRISLGEQARVTLWHTLPLFAGGMAMGRPRTRAALAAIGTPQRAIRAFDDIRERYRGLPVWMRGLSGRVLLVLTEPAVRRVLEESDAVFSLDAPDKHRMQTLFQPDAVILSRGRQREERRALNEVVLGDVNAHGDVARRLSDIVEAETATLLEPSEAVGTLAWPALRRGFGRVARRTVLGDQARDDVEITNLLHALRREANWLGAVPWRSSRVKRLRAELNARINGYTSHPAPGSLVSVLSDIPVPSEMDAAGQVPHWLTALELMAPVAARTLSLLGTHPMAASRVRLELETADRHHGPGTVEAVAAQPYLRACVWEAIRLWPPVPNLERVATRPVSWGPVTVPEGATVLIPALYFARDERRGGTANRLSPEQWIDGTAHSDWTLLPFSKGPGTCPGRDLATFLTVAGCAAIMRRLDLHALAPRWAPDRPLPKSSDPAVTRFAVSTRIPAGQQATAGATGES